MVRVMRNWIILNGRGWKEYDLGVGGRDSLSRGMLDILYGVVIKMYYFMVIFRYLFMVYLVVVEFDLVFVLFDSWFELVKKGKVRVEKMGYRELVLDDNVMVLEIIFVVVVVLCRYGGWELVDKVRKILEELEGLVKKWGELDLESVDLRDLVLLRLMVLVW